MHRTNTTSWDTFKRPNVVTFELPPRTEVRPKIASFSTNALPLLPLTPVTFRIPPSSPWTTGLHFHTSHTEYIRVLQGRASVTLGSITKTYESTDNDIRIDRFVIHEWQRASEDGDELVMQAWTDPADGVKEVFFRNLNSIILDVENATNEFSRLLPTDWWVTWQILTISPGLDEFPVLVERFGRGLLAKAVSGVLLWVVARIGWLVGLKWSYKEYTPSEVVGMIDKED